MFDLELVLLGVGFLGVRFAWSGVCLEWVVPGVGFAWLGFCLELVWLGVGVRLTP